MKRNKKNTNKPPVAFSSSFFLKLILGLAAFAAFASVVSISKRTTAQNKESSCINCHSKLEGRLGDPARMFENDIHRARGLSCNDCHGGDPTQDDKNAAKDPLKGYIEKPETGQIPALCGKCHSDAALMKKFNPSLRVDQVQEYFTSVHGTRLQAGDQKVATCVSCHGIHGIRAPSDPLSSVYPLNVAETCAKCHSDANRMSEYKIPHDQFDKYKTSVHAKALYEKQDLSAPTCNDCHGNHGATPPGIANVSNVCGQCHGRQSSLFQNSPHKSAFEQRKIAECLQCHSNHGILPPDDRMVGIGEGSSCTSCHQNDKGFTAAQTISGKIDELKTKMGEATEILERAERAGMEVSRPKFELREAVDSLTQARVLVHSSSVEEIEKTVAPGAEIAAKSHKAGEFAFAELSFRRAGLAVSLIFILFLALLVYLKIRQIEAREPLMK